jgi:hypothetical protein
MRAVVIGDMGDSMRRIGMGDLSRGFADMVRRQLWTPVDPSVPSPSQVRAIARSIAVVSERFQKAASAANDVFVDLPFKSERDRYVLKVEPSTGVIAGFSAAAANGPISRKTDWFPGTTAPARPGVYELAYRGGVGADSGGWCARWDGVRWFDVRGNATRALEERFVSPHPRPWQRVSPDYCWRGFTTKQD